ncbi:MAG: hypothetical protein RBJ76_02925 [Stenomitos frigidus ULC029]
MIDQSTRFAVCLGLLAGSLAIATAAHADIPITGGQATGDAAFFLPGTAPTATTPAGTPVLFDTAIQTLRLVTPNGTTTTSRFLPNASRFTDTNGNKIPDSGDTGRLEGTLSGVAFSANGNPIFFQGIPTALNFTLNTFSPSFLQGGTLISPQQAGTAPLVFLPVQNVTLSGASGTSFNSQEGLLSVGAFDAALTGDSIRLPSDLQLRSTTASNVAPVVLGRRIKFDFEGKDVLPTAGTDLNPSDGVIAFSGPTTKFQVQSVGTPGTSEFKLEGTVANLDLELTAPFSGTLTGTLSSAARTSYEVKGEGPGYVAFGNNTATFAGSARRDTQFKFEQSGGKLDGRSSGDVSFALRTGSGDFTSFTPAVGVNNNGTAFSGSSNTSNNTSNNTSSNTSSNTSNNTSSNTSSTTVSVTSTRTIVFTNFVANTTYIKLFNPSLFVVNSTDNDDDDDSRGDDDRRSRDNDDDDDNDSNAAYTIYRQRGSVEVVVERGSDDRILLVERDRNDRQLPPGQAKRRGRVVSAYQVVGLSSRVFPGLVGLQQIPAEQASTTPTSTTPAGTTTTPSGTTTPSSTTTPTAPTTPSGTTTTP